MTSGFWLQTFSGRAWDYERPSAADVDLIDMAHGLARQARFYGHTITVPHPYNVAQHSVLVARRVEELCGVLEEDQYLVYSPAHNARIALAGLLHDAPEYVLGDWVSPLKSLLRAHWHGYGPCPIDSLEKTHNAAIAEWAGLPSGDYLCLPVIKRADLELLATEARDVMAPAPRTWKPNPYEALPERIVPWSWQRSRDAFVAEFHRLRKAAGLDWHRVAGGGYGEERR